MSIKFSIIVLVLKFSITIINCRSIPFTGKRYKTTPKEDRDNQLNSVPQNDIGAQCLISGCEENYLLFQHGLPDIDSCIQTIPKTFTTVSINLAKVSWYESLGLSGGSGDEPFDSKEKLIYTWTDEFLKKEHCENDLFWTGFHTLHHSSDGDTDIEVLSVNQKPGYLTKEEMLPLFQRRELERTPVNDVYPSCVLRSGLRGLDIAICTERKQTLSQNTYKECQS